MNKISFKEFKERVSDQDGFGKTRRIIYFSSELGKFPYEFMLPMIGQKEKCLKVAYRLLIGDNHNEYEQELIRDYVKKGEFKVAIQYNFSHSLDVNMEVLWENNKIIDPFI